MMSTALYFASPSDFLLASSPDIYCSIEAQAKHSAPPTPRASRVLESARARNQSARTTARHSRMPEYVLLLIAEALGDLRLAPSGTLCSIASVCPRSSSQWWVVVGRHAREGRRRGRRERALRDPRHFEGNFPRNSFQTPDGHSFVVARLPRHLDDNPRDLQAVAAGSALRPSSTRRTFVRSFAANQDDIIILRAFFAMVTLVPVGGAASASSASPSTYSVHPVWKSCRVAATTGLAS